MKRTERHHLKENELQVMARQAREAFEQRRRETSALVAAVIVVGVAALGYYGWREHVQGRSHGMLAEAMAVADARIAPPPLPGASPAPVAPGTYANERARAEAALAKFKATADRYPSTDAGLFARYQEAATLSSLGRTAEAVARYEEVVKRAGQDSLYGQMARLGVAQSQALTGQYEQAITTFKDLSQRKDGAVPVDGVLMQLGRAYVGAGRKADAEQTFNRLVEEYPDSPFTADARRSLDELKKT